VEVIRQTVEGAALLAFTLWVMFNALQVWRIG